MSVLLLNIGESFDLDAAIDKRLSAWLSERNDETLKRLDGSSCTREQLLAELNTIPFLVECVVVLITGGDHLDKRVIEEVIAYSKSPNPKVKLLIGASHLKKNSRLMKVAGEVVFQPAEKEWQKEKTMPAWLIAHTDTEGKQLSVDAATLLIRWLGLDKRLLVQEIEKLICYVGDRRSIERGDVEALCQPCRVESIYKLGDAILERKGSEALGILRTMIADGAAPIGLMRQLRGVLQQNLHLLGLEHGEVGQFYPYLTERMLERKVGIARRYGEDGLRRGLILLDKVDRQCRNSSADLSLLLDRLVGSLV